jgi:hypothetical protein
MDVHSLRSVLIRYILALANLLFVWVPGGQKERGIALMTFHPLFFIAWIAIFFLYPSNHSLRFLIFLSACIIAFSQWLFRGCIVTKAEQLLTGTKETVMDPFLRFVGITPTHETRLAVTLGCSISVTSIMFLCVCMDHW